MTLPSPKRDHELRENLKELARRVPSRAMIEHHKFPPLDLHPLFDIVETVNGQAWEADRQAALLEVLRRAIDNIEDTPALETNISWRDAALTIYGFSDNILELGDHVYSQLVTKAMKKAGDRLRPDQRRDRDKLPEGVRTRLSEALLALELETLSPGENDGKSDDPPGGTDQASVVVHQLPGGASNFVGRLSQLDALESLAISTRAEAKSLSVAAVTGAPGVGKTGLVLRWANDSLGSFDSELYIDLRGYSPEPEVVQQREALMRFLRALGVEQAPVEASADELSAIYRNVLSTRRTLVFIDNARDSEHARLLMPGSGHCVAVVTSRDELTALRAQYDARWVRLEPLPPKDALDLMKALLGEARVGDDTIELEQITRLSGRLPLTIRVLAGAISNRADTPLEDIHRELLDESRRLDLMDADGDPRLDVRAVISWSYRSLDTTMLRAMSLLAIVPGVDIEPLAASALFDTAPRETIRVLERLKRLNLLNESIPGRFSFHDIISAYARERAHAELSEQSGQAALIRLREFYQAGIARSSDQLYPHEKSRRPEVPDSEYAGPIASKSEAREWLDVERMNHVALALTIENAEELELFASLLYRDLEVTGYYAEALEMYEQVFAGLDESAVRVRARVLQRLGLLRWRVGDSGDAIEKVEESIALYKRSGAEDTDDGLLAAEGNLAVVYANSGNFKMGIEVAQKVVDASLAAGNDLTYAYSVTNLGAYLAQVGKHEEALERLEAGVRVHRKIKNLQGEAIALGNMAASFDVMNRNNEVPALFERVLALYEELGDRNGIARSMNNLAISLLGLRCDMDRALSLSREAQEIQRDLRDAKHEIMTLLTQAEILALQDESGAALKCLDDALNLYPNADDTAYLPEMYYGVGKALWHIGDHEGASASFERAIREANKIDLWEVTLTSLEALGDMYADMGETSEARNSWRNALALSETNDSPHATQLLQKLNAD